MFLRMAAVFLFFLCFQDGLRSGPLLVHSIKDEDFAEFEDDDSEFDFEVSDEGDDDGEWVLININEC